MSNILDPFLFAYRPGRGTVDATLTLIDFTVKHTQDSKLYALALFIDFTSAFNTMQVRLLLLRLYNMNVNSALIYWIKIFLTDQPQSVSMNGIFSNELILNTGAPLLCLVYTNELQIKSDTAGLFKYADDMVLVQMCFGNPLMSEQIYFQNVAVLEDWCKVSALHILLL